MGDGTDALIVALTPGVVEAAKRAGLPDRYAGVAAIVAATALLALRELGAGTGVNPAGWLFGGVMLGLAAAGLYSQTRMLRRG